MRKIIQISSIFLPEGGGYNPSVHVYALCDDGGVWKHVTATDKWTPLPAIPQDEPEALHSEDAMNGKTALSKDQQNAIEWLRCAVKNVIDYENKCLTSDEIIGVLIGVIMDLRMTPTK